MYGMGKKEPSYLSEAAALAFSTRRPVSECDDLEDECLLRRQKLRGIARGFFFFLSAHRALSQPNGIVCKDTYFCTYKEIVDHDQ